MLMSIIRASDAMRAVGRPLVPAFSGCFECSTIQAIASPLLGACRQCGQALTIVAPETVLATGALRSEPAESNAA
jgi:hypothetical protein